MRDSPHGIFDPCAQWPRDLDRKKNCWRVVVAVGVTWKLKSDQIWAKVQFHQNWHVPKFQETSFFRNKSPCGSVPQEVTFSESTEITLFHFLDKIKNPRFPKQWKLDSNLPIKIHFLLKMKLVRMVHTHNFYDMGLEVSDKKAAMDENWNFEGVGNLKIQFWGPGWTFDFFYKSELDFKIIATPWAPSRPNLHIKIYYFKWTSCIFW